MEEITCGCGFKVTGDNHIFMKRAYENHNCPYKKLSPIGEIFDAIFSIPGIVIAFIVAGLIASLNHVSL